ncbi:unnamed protein product [Microthlaspi erraticum]|uniref:Arabidopsis retrotransposon Orf1 C-terminal domain-containing protein n=1 Tax=Microthlaspi erraticum TaxID=1685480 RepID=A0A6D2JHZ4_9BRAS|nr:unnamed protein product [Microthlaspi erraticum]
MEEEESEEEEDELPMYQEHYDALFSMDFVETKYPHDDTMKALGSLRCGVGPRTCKLHLAKFFSYRMESYKELTCEFLASMRQLEILFGFNYGEGTKWNFKEESSKGFGLQSLMECTLPQGQGSSDQEPSLEICAQGTCQHLLCKEGTGTINEGELKFLDMGIKPISHAQGWQEDQGR